MVLTRGWGNLPAPPRREGKMSLVKIVSIKVRFAGDRSTVEVDGYDSVGARHKVQSGYIAESDVQKEQARLIAETGG